MKINVNGKAEETAPCSLLDFIHQKGLSPEGIVVEHNHNIVKRKTWQDIQLQENDNLELLSFVGGG